ncbi:hypothetical protein, partial [Bacteroides helcogenes]
LANQTNGDSDNENTANCYVVSASGYYSFPLVYGNAIKDGTTNTLAYMEKPLYFDPFGQIGFTTLGRDMIDPLKSW